MFCYIHNNKTASYSNSQIKLDFIASITSLQTGSAGRSCSVGSMAELSRIVFPTSCWIIQARTSSGEIPAQPVRQTQRVCSPGTQSCRFRAKKKKIPNSLDHDHRGPSQQRSGYGQQRVLYGEDLTNLWVIDCYYLNFCCLQTVMHCSVLKLSGEAGKYKHHLHRRREIECCKDLKSKSKMEMKASPYCKKIISWEEGNNTTF